MILGCLFDKIPKSNAGLGGKKWTFFDASA